MQKYKIVRPAWLSKIMYILIMVLTVYVILVHLTLDAKCRKLGLEVGSIQDNIKALELYDDEILAGVKGIRIDVKKMRGDQK